VDSELDKYLQEGKEARQLVEKQWLLNMAFFVGNQWVNYNPITHALEKPKVPSYRVLMVDNQVQPTVRTELGKMTANKPKFFVVPSTDSGDDIKKAKTSEMLLEHHWYNLRLTQKTTEAALWALITGNGFAKVYWDSTAGQKFEEQVTDDMGMPVMDELGEPQMQTYTLVTLRWML
jgi:hypothetical protein